MQLECCPASNHDAQFQENEGIPEQGPEITYDWSEWEQHEFTNKGKIL